MGFWDTVGSVAKDVNGAIKEKSAELQELRALVDQYEYKSSLELREIVNNDGLFFGASRNEKKVAELVLRRRGEL